MRPEEAIRNALDENFIVGASMIVRKSGEEVVHTTKGYADVERQIPVSDATLFRLASMSKPVTAVAAMQLIEQGKLGLDDKLARWIPEFGKMKAAKEPIGFDEAQKYMADPDNPLMAKMLKARLDCVELIDVGDAMTIRDLLTHSSGLGMGMVSQQAMAQCAAADDRLADRVKKFAGTPLDFAPGAMTGYSAIAGFDTLGRVVEIVSGEDLDEYIREHIARPLGTDELGFSMTDAQRARMARLYEHGVDGAQTDVTESDQLWRQVDPGRGYCSGSAGMIGSLTAYDRFVQMLAGNGAYDGAQILRPETVAAMRTERAKHGREFMPGGVWGLGMAVFSEFERSGRYLGEGTFGWSGAYGTHFYIDTANDITVTLMVQSANIGGAGSPLSMKLEEAVYRTFAGA